MKWLITCVVALALLAAHTATATDTDDPIEKRLQAMERLIQHQQRQIQELQAALQGQTLLTRDEAAALIQREVDAIVETRIETGLAQYRDSSPLLTLGSGIERLDIRGDLRLRFDYIDADSPTDSETRERFRVRLRPGAVWQGDGWEIGVGLITGGSSAASGNATYSNSTIFETGDIRLDYAYARYAWGDLWLSLGQQPNPLTTSLLIWDADVRPVGLFLGYQHQDLFTTAGLLYTQDTDDNGADGYGAVGQIGYHGKLRGTDLTLVTGLTYLSPNTYDSDSEDLPITDADDDYNFLIWDVLAKAGWTFDNGVGLKLNGHLAVNLGVDDDASQLLALGQTLPAGYDPEDENIAWSLGAGLSYRALTLNYWYASIGGESVYQPLNGNGFGGGTILLDGGTASVDVQGHVIQLLYKVSPNLTLKASTYLVETIERTEDIDATQLYVDAIWKF